MAVTSLPHSQNGAKPQAGSRPVTKVVPLLAPQIDHLHELRDLIRRAQAEERRMTGDILRTMEAAGLTRLAGRQAVALIDQRTILKPDPQLFVEAVGEAAWSALTVSVTAARDLLGEHHLKAISETTSSPVLRVESLPAAPGAA